MTIYSSASLPVTIEAQEKEMALDDVQISCLTSLFLDVFAQRRSLRERVKVALHFGFKQSVPSHKNACLKNHYFSSLSLEITSNLSS